MEMHGRQYGGAEVFTENDTYRIVDKGISSAGLSGYKAQVDGTEG